MLWFRKKETKKIEEKKIEVLDEKKLESFLKIIEKLMDASFISLSKEPEDKVYKILHSGEIEDFEIYLYDTLSFFEYGGSMHFSRYEDAKSAWSSLSREEKDLYTDYWGER